MLGGLLCLGAANFFLVRRARRAPDTPLIRLRRFAEAEVGIGVAVFLCAASLTSTPPAVDIPDQTASFAEVVHRITPQWPRMTSPSHGETSIQQLQAKLDAQASTRGAAARAYIPGAGVPPPSNASDIAWSEFNHHWSGVFVLIVGLLALAERAGARWARHWPLAFLLLAAFLFIRSDPKYWPLGSIPFWEGMRDAEALQHRAAVLVVVLLAGFEWAVRNGRLTSPRAALVFPLLCAVGGAMLLTHSHSIADLKEELLVELTHLPLALLSLAAGWSRWLELRLPGPEGRAYGWVWPTSIALIGVLLLLYREA
jgi:putative copper resistance protein D